MTAPAPLGESWLRVDALLTRVIEQSDLFTPAQVEFALSTGARVAYFGAATLFSDAQWRALAGIEARIAELDR